MQWMFATRRSGGVDWQMTGSRVLHMGGLVWFWPRWRFPAAATRLRWTCFAVNGFTSVGLNTAQVEYL